MLWMSSSLGYIVNFLIVIFFRLKFNLLLVLAESVGMTRGFEEMEVARPHVFEGDPFRRCVGEVGGGAVVVGVFVLAGAVAVVSLCGIRVCGAASGEWPNIAL